MIEIPNGWTVGQTKLAHDIDQQSRVLKHTLESVELLRASLKALKDSCKHEHVEANGDDLWCTICGEKIGQ